MLLIDFLSDATRATFVLLGFVTLYDYARQHDGARLDVALFFGSLAYVLGVQEIFILFNLRPEWAVKSIQLALLAHAYLLLRVLHNLRPIPRWLMQTTLAGLVLSAAIWLAFSAPPAWLSALTVAYLGAVDAYAVVVLVRGALLTRGVTRQRLRFAALGAGLLAAALLVLVADTLLAALAPALTLGSNYLILVLATLSGLAFYVGFAAPRRLRRGWQLGELEEYLNASQSAPADEPVSAALERLCQAAARAAGGQGAFVVSRADPAASWSVAAATELGVAQWWVAHWPPGWGRLEGQQARALPLLPAPAATAVTRNPDGPAAVDAARVPGRTALLVPIGPAQPRQDVLAVVLDHRPLFPHDDQSLLALMCSHSALLLEQKRMIGQLRGQNQELTQANQELEAFAYSVSHDLRTPLRHIEGFAEALRDSSPGAEVAAEPYLERILSATGHMAHMIDVFLDFSRLGHSELAMTRVPLAALVAQVKDDSEAETHGRQVTWRIGPLPDVLGDTVLLRQAWTNLIGNALKYSRTRAEARIEIGALPADGGGSVIAFVRDNGVGFDPAYAGQLFTMFGRLHHASEFEGDGLGLAVVRRIVQRHNGRVWAEGTPDGGATFYMALPQADGKS